MLRTALAALTATLLVWPLHAGAADESGITLKPGPGRDQVMGYCTMCHSLDYIQGNSPFMNRQTWEAEVTKMMKAYGAQIPPEDVPKVVDYLNAHYGATAAPK